MINMLPPPRQIPLSVTIRSVFGGIRYQASWFFLGVNRLCVGVRMYVCT
jgi:hypothetical protein